MNFNAKILESAVTDEARARALSEYLDDVSENYAALMDLVQQSMDDEALEEAAYMNDQDQPVYDVAVISEWIRSHGYEPSTLVACRDGYVSLIDLIKHSVLYVNDGDVTIELDNNNGTSIMNMEDVFSDMQSTLHATVSMSATALASISSTVADRLTVFRDKLSTKFKSAYDDLSGTANYYATILSQDSASTIDVVNQIVTDLSADAISLAAEAGQQAAPNMSNMFSYTGASPIGALDWSTALSIGETSIKIITSTVAAVVKGIVNLAKKAFKWLKKKVVQTVVDPMDLYTVNSNNDAVNSIDGWEYQSPVTASVNSSMLSLEAGNIITNEFLAFGRSKYCNKWFAYRFFFGELLFKFDNIEDAGNNCIKFSNPIIKFKPYVLNPSDISSVLSSNPDHLSYDSENGVAVTGAMATYEGIANTFSKITDSDYLLSVKNDEKAAGQGLAMAWQFLQITLIGSYYEAINSGALATISTYTPTFKTTYTNADFVQLASGWDKDPSEPGFSVANILYTSQGNPENDDELIAYCLNPISFQMLDRFYNPTGYTFLPYESNIAGFLPSRYAVKTDEQNRDAFNTFMTSLVIIVFVAVVAISTTVLLRRLAKRIFWRRQEFVSQMDAKLWNGEKLTASERRKYLRYARKLRASSFLTGNMIDSGSETVSSSSYSSNEFATLASLITGKNS